MMTEAGSLVPGNPLSGSLPTILRPFGHSNPTSSSASSSEMYRGMCTAIFPFLKRSDGIPSMKRPISPIGGDWLLGTLITFCMEFCERAPDSIDLRGADAQGPEAVA